MTNAHNDFMDTLTKDSDKGPPREIRARTFAYALRAVKLYQHLQNRKDGAGWILGKKYLRAATSIGANVAEAQAGESRADFVHKLGIAQKEARESLFWLRLLAESKIVGDARLRSLVKETEELIAVVTAILVSTKKAPSN
ncbi:MAG: four helix bundle protein [Terriglobia bacterium]|jgi:four helix bundle protein